jgi:phosphoglycolate phosphatase
MIAAMDTRLVVFDMDGTLVDSQHLIVDAMTRAFTQVGHPLPARDQILGIVGLSLHEAMVVLAPHLPEVETRALAASYVEGFVAQRAAGGPAAHAPLYPGARAALERLTADPRTRLGVATGKARPGLVHTFETHGIGDFFVTTQTADAHPSKPHPSMLHQSLADTGCVAVRAVMVGDTEFDIAMGRAAGFATVGVAWGYHPRARLEAAGADVIIDSFDAIDAALDALLSARAERLA